MMLFQTGLLLVAVCLCMMYLIILCPCLRQEFSIESGTVLRKDKTRSMYVTSSDTASVGDRNGSVVKVPPPTQVVARDIPPPTHVVTRDVPAVPVPAATRATVSQPVVQQRCDMICSLHIMYISCDMLSSLTHATAQCGCIQTYYTSVHVILVSVVNSR